MKKVRNFILIMTTLSLACLWLVSSAGAVDAPKWVAGLYIEAQKAIGLRWMPVPGASAFKVLRSSTAGSGYVEIASITTPQHFDKAVEPGETYYYVLQAVVGGEVSGNSEELSVKIPGEKKREVMPPTWSKITQQASTEFGKTSYKVGIFWNPVDEAIAYNVYRSLSSGKDYQLVTSTSESQYIDPDVGEGKTYFYVLSALDNSFIETKYSEEGKITIKKPEKKKERRKRVKIDVAPRKSKIIWSREREADGLPMKEPFDIALSKKAGILFATSNSTQQVVALRASSGDLLFMVGEKGKDPGQFLYPLGLGLDDDGRLYVADRVKQSVQIFEGGNGAFIREMRLVPPTDTEIKLELPVSPIDVAVDPASGDIFVADRNNHIIWVLDSAGNFQRFFGVPGKEPGQINSPQFIRFNREGNLMVCNSNQGHIDTYKPDGTHLKSIVQKGAAVGAVVMIAGFEEDSDGNILVVDKSSSNIQGFLPDGRYLFHLANEKGDGGVELYAPKAIEIDGNDMLFVCEGLIDRLKAIQILEPAPPPQQEAEDEVN